MRAPHVLAALVVLGPACSSTHSSSTGGSSSSSGGASSSSSSGGSFHLTVTPAQCDFGPVGVGLSVNCDVTVANDPTDPGPSVSVVSLAFSADTSPAFPPPTAVVPTVLEPGNAVVWRLSFHPNTAGDYAGAFILTTTDPAMGTVTIPLSGSGAAVTTAIPRLLSVNSVPNDSPYLHALDNVLFTGAASVPSSSSATIQSFHWELLHRPAESTVTLTRPDDIETGLSFNDSGVVRTAVDVVGLYIVGLTVTDSAGNSSHNNAAVSIVVTPTTDVYVQMTWDDPVSDLDLHLVRNSGPEFSPSGDCYYANCTLGDALHWGTDSVVTPNLFVNDTNGFGPEAISFTHPQLDDYFVGVHWYSGGATAINATARIYIGGALASVTTRLLTTCNQYWSVAKIRWNDAPTVERIDAVSTDTHGSCF